MSAEKLFFFNSPLTQLRLRDSPRARLGVDVDGWDFTVPPIWMSGGSSSKKVLSSALNQSSQNWKFNDTRWHPERANLVLTFFTPSAGRKEVLLSGWERGGGEERGRGGRATPKIKLNSIIARYLLSPSFATRETPRVEKKVQRWTSECSSVEEWRRSASATWQKRGAQPARKGQRIVNFFQIPFNYDVCVGCKVA